MTTITALESLHDQTRHRTDPDAIQGVVCCCSKTAQLPTTKIPLNLFVTTSYHLVHQISIYWQSFKSANNFSIFIIFLCCAIYCSRTGNRFSTIMAPYNYEPVSIIYGFSLPQFPDAFTQTHIYFMALHSKKRLFRITII